jgi:hypothetical protein
MTSRLNPRSRFLEREKKLRCEVIRLALRQQLRFQAISRLQVYLLVKSLPYGFSLSFETGTADTFQGGPGPVLDVFQTEYCSPVDFG